MSKELYLSGWMQIYTYFEGKTLSVLQHMVI